MEKQNIAVTQPNMELMSQRASGLSAFGLLSTAFADGIMERSAGAEDFYGAAYRPLALDYLEDEPAQPMLPPRQRYDMNLHLVLELFRKAQKANKERNAESKAREQETIERITERVTRTLMTERLTVQTEQRITERILEQLHGKSTQAEAMKPSMSSEKVTEKVLAPVQQFHVTQRSNRQVQMLYQAIAFQNQNKMMLAIDQSNRLLNGVEQRIGAFALQKWMDSPAMSPKLAQRTAKQFAAAKAQAGYQSVQAERIGLDAKARQSQLKGGQAAKLSPRAGESIAMSFGEVLRGAQSAGLTFAAPEQSGLTGAVKREVFQQVSRTRQQEPEQLPPFMLAKRQQTQTYGADVQSAELDSHRSGKKPTAYAAGNTAEQNTETGVSGSAAEQNRVTTERNAVPPERVPQLPNEDQRFHEVSAGRNITEQQITEALSYLLAEESGTQNLPQTPAVQASLSRTAEEAIHRALSLFTVKGVQHSESPEVQNSPLAQPRSQDNHAGNAPSATSEAVHHTARPTSSQLERLGADGQPLAQTAIGDLTLQSETASGREFEQTIGKAPIAVGTLKHEYAEQTDGMTMAADPQLEYRADEQSGTQKQPRRETVSQNGGTLEHGVEQVRQLGSVSQEHTLLQTTLEYAVQSEKQREEAQHRTMGQEPLHSIVVTQQEENAHGDVTTAQRNSSADSNDLRKRQSKHDIESNRQASPSEGAASLSAVVLRPQEEGTAGTTRIGYTSVENGKAGTQMPPTLEYVVQSEEQGKEPLHTTVAAHQEENTHGGVTTAQRNSSADSNDLRKRQSKHDIESNRQASPSEGAASLSAVVLRPQEEGTAGTTRIGYTSVENGKAGTQMPPALEYAVRLEKQGESDILQPHQTEAQAVTAVQQADGVAAQKKRMLANKNRQLTHSQRMMTPMKAAQQSIAPAGQNGSIMLETNGESRHPIPLTPVRQQVMDSIPQGVDRRTEPNRALTYSPEEAAIVIPAQTDRLTDRSRETERSSITYHQTGQDQMRNPRETEESLLQSGDTAMEHGVELIHPVASPITTMPQEKNYLSSQPKWVQDFVGESFQPAELRHPPAPQTQEPPSTSQHGERPEPSQPVLAVSPAAEQQTVWSAPGYSAAGMVYKPAASRQSTESTSQQTKKLSEQELRKTADEVYRIIEDRLRVERRRMGL